MADPDPKPPDPQPVAPKPSDPPASIPYARFEEVIGERNTARAALGPLQAQVATLTRDLEIARGDLASRSAGWEEERLLMRAGLTDPEAVDVARLLHGRLPVEGRPKLVDWVAGHGAKPEEAPLALRGYLGRAPAAVPKVPPGSNGNPSAPPPTGEVTAAMIREAREIGERSGDWTRYRALRAPLGIASRESMK